MLRELTSHKVNGLNDAIVIGVIDEPGSGGACHRYHIGIPMIDPADCSINFQDGPIQEVGFNGLSNEALLAVVEDRLKGFQSGQYACHENAVALMHVQHAMQWLLSRTRERLQRGVEGTSQR